jgi:4-hydroxy-3-polyprenylbenzoate decarboxylase
LNTPPGHRVPVLGNLLAARAGWPWAWGVQAVGELRQFGQVLAELKEPQAPKGLKDLVACAA